LFYNDDKEKKPMKIYSRFDRTKELYDSGEIELRKVPTLRGADLREADLRGADLREADLRGADLRGADLREADLSGAIGAFSVFSGGQHQGIAHATHISIGCQRYTHAEWRENFAEIGAKNKYTPEQIERYRAWIFSLDWLLQ
jgi:hypothetical protein